MKYAIFDVGASRGSFSHFVAKQSDDNFVLAIEPQREVAKLIKRKTNLFVEEVAVGIATDHQLTRPLHVMSNSELSTFLDSNENIDKSLWVNHLSALQEISTIEVPVVSLSYLMDKYQINQIDFLKIDTQGTDLEVLESAGDRLKDIKAAVLEFPYREDSALYSGEIEISQAVSRLKNLGFTAVRIVPNGAGECNVFLSNDNLPLAAYFALEANLNLRNAPTLKIEELTRYRYMIKRITIQARGFARKIVNKLTNSGN